jgi:hypothetical protein
MDRRVLALLFTPLLGTPASADWHWIEGEKPTKHSMNRHPWWYDQVKRGEFSGGDFISNFSDDKPGEAGYTVTVKKAGVYRLWVRANPLHAKLAFRINDDGWTDIELDKNQFDNVNVAGDGKPDLRFLAWVDAGEVRLNAAYNAVVFRMAGGRHNHGYLDCFVLTNEPFAPKGKCKPGSKEAVAALEETKGWFPFKPSREFSPDSVIDLRHLNEKFAGEHGRILAKGSTFVREKDGKEVKFWPSIGAHSACRKSNWNTKPGCSPNTASIWCDCTARSSRRKAIPIRRPSSSPAKSSPR